MGLSVTHTCAHIVGPSVTHTCAHIVHRHLHHLRVKCSETTSKNSQFLVLFTVSSNLASYVSTRKVT